ncbi:MAG TPA: flagellar hook-length control protein FliK, partial [bacterium]|nr:flagellar hook-length control protein FliK [bacterium]
SQRTIDQAVIRFPLSENTQEPYRIDELLRMKTETSSSSPLEGLLQRSSVPLPRNPGTSSLPLQGADLKSPEMKNVPQIGMKLSFSEVPSQPAKEEIQPPMIKQQTADAQVLSKSESKVVEDSVKPGDAMVFKNILGTHRETTVAKGVFAAAHADSSLSISRSVQDTQIKSSWNPFKMFSARAERSETRQSVPSAPRDEALAERRAQNAPDRRPVLRAERAPVDRSVTEDRRSESQRRGDMGEMRPKTESALRNPSEPHEVRNRPESSSLLTPRSDAAVSRGTVATPQIESSPRVFSQPLVEQVADQVGPAMRGGISEMTIRLEPEDLGPVQVKVTLEEGLVVARLQSGNGETRGILERNLQQLAQALREQGIPLAEVRVNATTATSDRTNAERERPSNYGEQRQGGNHGGQGGSDGRQQQRQERRWWWMSYNQDSDPTSRKYYQGV